MTAPNSERTLILPVGSPSQLHVVEKIWPGFKRDLIITLAARYKLPAVYYERLYVVGRGGVAYRYGILIYTGTAGAQGTLGGLVGTSPRFARILSNALERSAICANDPICAEGRFGILVL
jgi:hypothetical protein